MVRWCWVKLPVIGRPTNLDNSRAWVYCVAVGTGEFFFDIFSSIFSLPASLWGDCPI